MQPPLFAGVAAFLVELTRWARADASTRIARITTIGVVLAVVAFDLFAFTRTRELLPAHPVAAPFRDAILAANSGSDRIVVLPRSPFAVFARYYGVQSDETVFDVYAIRVPRERNRRSAPTAEEAAAVTDATPFTIVGVVPARDAKQRTAEDPIAFARAVAATRGIALPDIPTPDGTARVVTIHFDGHGVIVIDPLVTGR